VDIGLPLIRITLVDIGLPLIRITLVDIGLPLIRITLVDIGLPLTSPHASAFGRLLPFLSTLLFEVFSPPGFGPAPMSFACGFLSWTILKTRLCLRYVLHIK